MGKFIIGLLVGIVIGDVIAFLIFAMLSAEKDTSKKSDNGKSKKSDVVNKSIEDNEVDN